MFNFLVKLALKSAISEKKETKELSQVGRIQKIATLTANLK